jgi:uncharacterized protein with GYD domain
MAHYLVQVGYTSDAVAGMVKNPEDRTQAVRSAVEAVGGKLVTDLYLCFGEYDAVAIGEFPDNVNAVALSMAFTATGRYRSFFTTPLITMAEATQAMRAAGRVSVRPAGN